MQGLAQRVTAAHPDRVDADASYGELAWIWGAPSAYTAERYEGVRQATAYPSSTIMWLDEANKTFRELSRDAPLIRTKTAG